MLCDTMKKILRPAVAVLNILVLLLLGVLVAGCSSMSQSDRDFYYSGWVNPNAPEKQDVLPPAP
jgi:hypothetical protein